MKIFLTYFFTLRWWKAVKSIFVDEDIMTLESILESGGEVILCQAIPGQTEKKMIKELKALRKNVDLYPLGLKLPLDDNIKLTEEEFVAKCLTGAAFRPVALSEKGTEKVRDAIAQSDSNHGDIGSFRFHIHQFIPQDNIPDLLSSVLREGWQKVMVRQGNFPTNCPNCEEPFRMSEELTCSWCDIDVDDAVEPPESVDQYKMILKYEETSGKEILERIA